MTLSTYEFKARLAPGGLVTLPLVVVGAVFGLPDYQIVTAVGAVVTFAGRSFVLSDTVGNRGRASEPALWDSWGGSPTLRLLRLREPTTNAHRRDLWRAAVTTYTSIALLDAAGGINRPEDADAAIEAADSGCRHLGHGGDAGRTLVQAENANYGYQRNLLGLRWYGRGISVAALAFLCAVLILSDNASNPALPFGIVADLGLLLAWLFLPSEERTKAAAERYARQLLDAVATERRP